MKAIALSGLALFLWGATPVPVSPPQPGAAAPAPEGPETLGYADDPHARMTVQVNVAGRGPYPFIVDTGAERTVISQELAHQLGLPDPGRAVLHSATEMQEVDTVRVPTLEVGRRHLRNLRVPLLQRENLGAEGLLGLDSLQSQNVIFDFVERELTVGPSGTPPPRRGGIREEQRGDTIVVTARNRLGRLILADASVGGQRVQVIVDTGASITIGNSALRQRLIRSGRIRETGFAELISVTGGRLNVERSLAGRVRIGGATIDNLPIGFSDAAIFRQLGLANRPALLLGMDALRLFDRISIDFASRRVTFKLPLSDRPELNIRMAAAVSGDRRLH